MSALIGKLRSIGNRDLSGALNERAFNFDDLARYGIQGSVTRVAFDQVQSLLAIGTSSGAIHIFGQVNVEVIIQLPSNRSSVDFLSFVAGKYIVAVDGAGILHIVSLEQRTTLYSNNISGNISCIATDPTLDWVFIGLESGQIITYDADRGCMSPFRIGNLQKAVLPSARLSHVISIELSPREYSVLLVAYKEIVVLFSLVENNIIRHFKYDLPAGAPGGDTNAATQTVNRSPPCLGATWHPNGHHVVTWHVDGSIVFWDAAEGNLLQARTVTDANVNEPKRSKTPPGGRRLPITGLAWICEKNPENTSILVAGGDIDCGPIRGLTYMDYGPTPTVAVTSYAAMGTHYGTPKRTRMFPITEGAEVTDFFPLGAASPFYNRFHDPGVVVVLLNIGEIYSIKLPEGVPIHTAAIMPPSIGWVHPHTTTLNLAAVPRNQWVGMMASVKGYQPYLVGGAPAQRHLRRFQTRNALSTGHMNGFVRIWDASRGELQESKVLEVDTKDALKTQDGVPVSKVSFAGQNAELAVAVGSGHVILYKFDVNKNPNPGLDRIKDLNLSESKEKVIDIRHRFTPGLKEGFMPISLINMNYGNITALDHSNVGFVAIGYENGRVVIIDRRGPAIIFDESVSQGAGGGVFRSRNSGIGSAHVTRFEFSICCIDDDEFSSIVLFAGTSNGELLTYRFVPNGRGGYKVEYVNRMRICDDKILAINAIDAEKGSAALAFPHIMAKLGQDVLIPGTVVVTSVHDVRVIRPSASKMTHKKFPQYSILGGSICFLREGDSMALVCITDTSELVCLALPSLREMSVRKLPYRIDSQTATNSVFSLTGDIIIQIDRHEAGLISVFGKGVKFEDIPGDLLYDPLKVCPPRPVVSTLQWVRGSVYTTKEDIDKLIGGARRPKSKTMIQEEEHAREEQRRQRDLERRKHQERVAHRQKYDEYYTGAGDDDDYYDEDGVRRRNNGGIQGAWDNLEETGQSYLNSVNESIKEAQNDMFKGILKSKFGF
ncbi:Lethal(2) giant larvae protein-like protein SRO77 [Yarrowia sp. C11]|nr:Lethal(2) giant larvae protein-like protein SRO77 [Yarrowia sp. E02]KAG5367626.1 Lethal(2) giant larvae protein-like protein SRO77 [Yarrowia sp. C11]